MSFDDSFLIPVESNEVTYVISELKDKTAAGFDKLSVKLLKHISLFFVYIALPLKK